MIATETSAIPAKESDGGRPSRTIAPQCAVALKPAGGAEVSGSRPDSRIASTTASDSACAAIVPAAEPAVP